MTVDGDLCKVVHDATRRIYEQKKLGTENKERIEKEFKASLKPFFPERTYEELEEYPFQLALRHFYKHEPDEWEDMDPAALQCIQDLISGASALLNPIHASAPSVSLERPVIPNQNTVTICPTPTMIPSPSPSGSTSTVDTLNQDGFTVLEAFRFRLQKLKERKIDASLAALKDFNKLPKSIQENLKMFLITEVRVLALQANALEALNALHSKKYKGEILHVDGFLAEVIAEAQQQRADLKRVRQEFLDIVDE
ncbi:hypothetical protein SCHPADRAFT_941900, partial [Schizopora paradoxa]